MRLAMRVHIGEPGWIRITGNPTRRLKAAVVCSGVTYCGPTMRVHAFMIRICVWHSFRARGEIFWRCRNVARIAVMTRRAGRDPRKNAESANSDANIVAADKNGPRFITRHRFFFCDISDRPSIDYFCYARTSNVRTAVTGMSNPSPVYTPRRTF